MVRELRRVAAVGIAAVFVAAAALTAAGSPGLAACQRVIVINPEVTVGEGAGRLIFTVFSGGCAASGQVGFTVTAGTAQPGADFTLSGNQPLRWAAGDVTVRRITASVALDTVPEPALEDFRVTLVGPSSGVRVVHGTGHGRILDDDGLGFAWAADDQICPPWTVGTSTPVGEPWLTGEQRYLCDFDDGVIDAVSPEGPASVRWATADGTAQAGIDYVGVADRVALVPTGAKLVQLPVKLLPRPVGTPQRWFQVRIFAPSRGVVVDGVSVVTLPGS
ncbi:Calx-beta domain-containing protein [Catellatospora methionotrophica]|uniref:Calx-beta domain-containing protein n=1 Tax=Catellatospora methionotrophica TaxID=121620 RepID=UPI0033CD3131